MTNSKYIFLIKFTMLIIASIVITYLYFIRNLEEMKEFFGWSFIPSILIIFPIIIIICQIHFKFLFSQ